MTDYTKLSLKKLRQLRKLSYEKRFRSRKENTYAYWDAVYRTSKAELERRHKPKSKYSHFPMYLRKKLESME
jgi:hypothetical protein